MQCKFCGAEGLHWEGIKNVWNLHEPDGDYHQCSQNDRAKYRERLEEQEKEKKEAAKKHRQQNGYLA